MVARRTAALTLALGAIAGTVPAWAASNNSLTVTPASGSTLAGPPSFTAPAPGCTGTANGMVVTLTGPGLTGTNADGSGNITSSVPAIVGGPISMDTGGVSWDGIAIAKSIPRPLNGTYTVKIQCQEDGDTTGNAHFDRDIAFTSAGPAGAPGTWVAVGQTSGPTPTPPAPAGLAFLLRMPAIDVCGNPEPSGGSCGSLTITVPVSSPETVFGPLSTGSVDGVGYFVASAAIPSITVTDNRAGLLPWQVSGVLSPFATAAGPILPSAYAGWEPQVTTPGVGATAAPPVLPGYPVVRDGLSVTRLLAYAGAGHGGVRGLGSTTLGGRLNVRIPQGVPQGDYRTTLTLTVMS